MKRKKLIAFIVVTLFIMTTVIGCTNKADSNESSDKTTVNKKNNENTNNNENNNQNVNDNENAEFSYPMDHMDTTLSVYAPDILWAETMVTSQSENYWHKNLGKQVGVNIEWVELPSGGNTNQYYNLLVASDDLPDIIYDRRIQSEAKTNIEDNLIIPINEYMEEYAPNYLKLCQQYNEFDKFAKTDDGDYYGFLFHPKLNAAMTIWRGPAVRSDLLKENGLDAPVTIEDWGEMLKAFKDNNGVVFSAPQDFQQDIFLGAYDTELDFFVTDDQKIVYGPALDNYKEALSLMNRWFEADYIDVDYPTVTNDMLITKVMNDSIGAMMVGTGVFTTLTQKIEAIGGSTMAWESVAYPVMNAGDVVEHGHCYLNYGPNAAGITTSMDEEKLEIALRFLDYGYSEEGSMYWSFGEEGYSYNMVDGYPTFTDVIMDAPNIEQAVRMHIGLRANGFAFRHVEINQWESDAANKLKQIWVDNQNYMAHQIPLISPTYDEKQESTSLESAITTYAKEMYYKFIMGEADLEEFDEYVDTLNSMGLPRLLEIKNNQLDRYNNR